MKTTLDLPEDLIHEVKLRALHQRRTVKDLVAECLRQGLGMPSLGRTEKPPASSRVVTRVQNDGCLYGHETCQSIQRALGVTLTLEIGMTKV